MTQTIMERPLLSLDTLALANKPDPRSISPLPSPVAPLNSSGGKRTHDFFGTPTAVAPPTKAQHLSALPPAALSTGSPRHATLASLGLGDSPIRRSASLKVSGHGLPLDPPSRLPSLLPLHAPLLSQTASSGEVDPQEDALQPGKSLGGDYEMLRLLGTGAFSKVVLARPKGKKDLAPCAVKVINRSIVERNSRMKISVQREVEVLKHIRHPCLTHLISAFDVPGYTCLVLEYAAGGELFDVVTQRHPQVIEPFARRIFGELADVLGWMHSIGLVHRDVKLENPKRSLDEQFKSPLIKLTDFGLSRFIDLGAPTLTTRCGSEEYAAPELIMGQPYDGRQTDAWALGVVLYALLTSHFPFFPLIAHESPLSASFSSSGRSTPERASRRSRLMRIAKAEYTWPDDCPLATSDARAVVDTLLIRDPAARARVDDVFDQPWMAGDGAVVRRRRSQSEGLDDEQVWVKWDQGQQDILRAEVEPL